LFSAKENKKLKNRAARKLRRDFLFALFQKQKAANP